MTSIRGCTYFVTGDWFKHAKKITLDAPPESMDRLREVLSKELSERVGKIYYVDPHIQFLVEVKTVSDLKDMCQLQVETWEPAGAAMNRLHKLAEAGKPGQEWGGEPQSEKALCARGGQTRGSATGWGYVEESELGTVVALNVGGKLFTSSFDTFTRVKDSLLAGMLCGRFPIARDFDGNIFIDRDPKMFRLVLNYLRDEHLSPPRDSEMVEALLAEARYFQLPELERLLQDAWKQTCVLFFCIRPDSGLVHTLHIDGPVEAIKGIRAAVSEVLGSEHCTYSLDGTMLTLELDAARGGVEMPSHALGSLNHPHSLLAALQGQGWAVFAQDICGISHVNTEDESHQQQAAASQKPPLQRSAWQVYTQESNAVSRALNLGGGRTAVTETKANCDSRPQTSLVMRFLLHR
jgi:hypothetical protein